MATSDSDIEECMAGPFKELDGSTFPPAYIQAYLTSLPLTFGIIVPVVALAYMLWQHDTSLAICTLDVYLGQVVVQLVSEGVCIKQGKLAVCVHVHYTQMSRGAANMTGAAVLHCRKCHVGSSASGISNLQNLAAHTRLLPCGCCGRTRLVVGHASRPHPAVGFQLWCSDDVDTIDVQMAFAAKGSGG